MFAAHDDYKVPDLVVFDEAAASERGVDGSPRLVIEIRSPGDETADKIGWYLSRRTGAVLVVDRDTLALELHGPDGPMAPAADGSYLLPGPGVVIGSDGLTLTVDGERLQL